MTVIFMAFVFFVCAFRKRIFSVAALLCGLFDEAGQSRICSSGTRLDAAQNGALCQDLHVLDDRRWWCRIVGGVLKHEVNE